MAARIQAKFCWKPPISHISRPFLFSFSKFLILKFLRTIFGPFGSQNFKRYFSHSFTPISSKFQDKYICHRRIQAFGCFGDPPKIKYFMALWIVCQHRPCVAVNFKTLLFYRFHSISIKLHEDIGYYGEIQAIAFLGNWPSFKQKCGTLSSHRRQWEVIKCAISWKRLTVERNGWKFGTRGPRSSIYVG